MKRDFTNENLERFLRQNADGLRMQPSEKVWKGISSHLNRRNRRFGFLLAFGLIITTGLGYYFTSSNEISPDILTGKNLPAASLHAGSMNSIALNGQTAKTTKTVSENSFLSGKQQLSQIPLDENSKNIQAAIVTEKLPSVPASNDFATTIVDSYWENQKAAETTGENNITTPGNVQALYPLTIESVVNAYKPRIRSGRFGLQLYFTPTVSYRKLNDNHIDNVVTHKPDFGFEMGIAAKYKIGRNLKIRGGVQFNVNRYDIKTYNATTQMATIRLSNRFGFDSLNTVTNYNNFGGYKSDWLENFSFQVSAPVGLELKLRGDDKMQFGVASTIQPTYILGDRAYLISSDYKNYAEVPRLIRRWNVNTSLETFVAYSTGKLKWQVGPQVRYQLLSSYVKKYQVKENLFDFGLKVGISLNNH